jgi:hypothetical protein
MRDLDQVRPITATWSILTVFGRKWDSEGSAYWVVSQFEL